MKTEENWFHVRADALKEGQRFAIGAFDVVTAYIKRYDKNDTRVFITAEVYRDKVRNFVFDRDELLWIVVTAVD